VARWNRSARALLAIGCTLTLVASSTTARAGSNDADGTYELVPLPAPDGGLGEILEDSGRFEVVDGRLTGIRTQRYFYPDDNLSCTVSIQIFDASVEIEGSTLSGTARHRQTWGGTIAVDLSRDECATTDGTISETVNVTGEVSGSTIFVDAFDEERMFGDQFTLRRVGDAPGGSADPSTSAPPTSSGGATSTMVPPDIFTAFTDNGFTAQEVRQLVSRIEGHADPTRRPDPMSDTGVPQLLNALPRTSADTPTPAQLDAVRALSAAWWLAAYVTDQGHPVMPSVAAARPILTAMAASALQPGAPPDQAQALARTIRLLVGMDLSRDAPP
jgi:hypothetical protein